MKNGKARLSLKRLFLNKEALGIVIAVCAILISAASFYATYLQAKAAEKQVKAMTMPLLRFVHGNYDSERQANALSFSFENAGVGPALLQGINIYYKDKVYNGFDQFIGACCKVEWESYREATSDMLVEDITQGGMVTSPLKSVIIPGQQDYGFLRFYRHESSEALWDKINDERWNIEVEVCYCSLLDQCFLTQKGNVITEVEFCPNP